jgi:hypothetical protein
MNLRASMGGLSHGRQVEGSGGASLGSTCAPSGATIDNMSRHRHFLFLAITAVVAGLAIEMWIRSPRPTAITLEHAAKIEQGMNWAEVHALLGGPPRDESTRPVRPACVLLYDGYDSMHAPSAEWASDDAIVWVYLVDGRVHLCKAMPAEPASKSVIDMVRRWVHM